MCMSVTARDVICSTAEAYRETSKAISDAVGDRLVIQITSEAVGRYQPAEQMAVVRGARPEAVSLALRELVPDATHETAFANFLSWLKSEQIIPQIILYTPEEASALALMHERGLVPFDDVPVLYVLGRYTPGQVSRPADLLAFFAPDRPRFAHWMVCAFGREETACVAVGALLGGHARVGFENNFALADGTIARDNAALVTATKRALTACGVRFAQADDLRSRLVDPALIIARFYAPLHRALTSDREGFGLMSGPKVLTPQATDHVQPKLPGHRGSGRCPVAAMIVSTEPSNSNPAAVWPSTTKRPPTSRIAIAPWPTLGEIRIHASSRS